MKDHKEWKEQQKETPSLLSFFLSIFFFLIFQVAQTEILQQEITNHLQHLMFPSKGRFSSKVQTSGCFAKPAVTEISRTIATRSE